MFKRMNHFERVCLGIFCTVITAFILLFSVYIVVQTTMEAEWYTRITGVEVTWKDAFWLDLDPSKYVIILEQNRRELK